MQHKKENKPKRNCLVVEIRVVPSSGKTDLMLDAHGKLKCYLKSPPEKGKANKELIHFIAQLLHCTQGLIEILTGETSRKKRIKINKEMTYEQFLHSIGITPQEQRALF